MSVVELLFLSVGLATDAFAVSVCKGLKMKVIDRRYSLLIAAFFGTFQAVMPLLGWFLGKQFAQYIMRYDHWIAFFLLSVIGLQMIWEAFHGEEDTGPISYQWKELFLLSIATSIDALAIGVTLVFLDVTILPTVLTIGGITFALSLLGISIGNRFGIRYKSRAEVFGGIILIGIGLKILLEYFLSS